MNSSSGTAGAGASRERSRLYCLWWAWVAFTTKDPARRSRNHNVKTDFTTKARRTRSLKAQISETFVAFVIFVVRHELWLVEN